MRCLPKKTLEIPSVHRKNDEIHQWLGIPHPQGPTQPPSPPSSLGRQHPSKQALRLLAKLLGGALLCHAALLQNDHLIKVHDGFQPRRQEIYRNTWQYMEIYGNMMTYAAKIGMN